ncbi:ribonuclease inhibitor-like isoform X2 [Colossoma macropomum]|uniref:ribonuclease inhibitor-like isoform X2 n=1 Tax=Colossoma macropomum TaxID=42526 RepID=UPI001863C281|nr:ribonuclease inhibitor-like isoform X2 [Colossoma macropomum]
MAHSDRHQDSRVVLLGNVGAGKSESGNTLLGSSRFLSRLSASAVTQQCEAQTVTLGGKRIMVVDTPGLTAEMDSNTAKKKLLQCLQLSDPGPHVFLLVIPVGRFTQDERDTVDRVIEVFGQKLYMFTIILFTFKDILKNASIEEYISTAGDSLQQLVQKCSSRYHSFNNENPGEKGQVRQLIAKIDKLVAANGGRWYTNTDDEMEDLERRLKHQHLGGGSLTSKMSLFGEPDRGKLESAQKERVKITKTHLESIFQELEHKVISLVKNQLKRFKNVLSPDFPACSEREVEGEVNQSVREGTLQIALHVLRNMNQTDLANTLQSRNTLQTKEELDEFDLTKYGRSEECLLRLLPVVTASRKAKLCGCKLSKRSCAALASALSSTTSSLRELDLSLNDLNDSGVKLLSAGLENPHCKLEILRIHHCSFKEKGCIALVKALKSNPSHLRELDLDDNEPGESGVKMLSALLEDPHCKLEKLQLRHCGITEKGCKALVKALKSNPSHLRELDLDWNKPKESGVKMLSALLEDPHCKLETLQLCGCDLSKENCAALSLAISSTTSSLRELDLSFNNLQDSGVTLLSAGLENPHCKLEKLRLCNCSITETGCVSLVRALKSNPSHLRELDLDWNQPGESGLQMLSALLQDPHYKLEKLDI